MRAMTQSNPSRGAADAVLPALATRAGGEVFDMP